jgi:hypothetical protein
VHFQPLSQLPDYRDGSLGLPSFRFDNLAIPNSPDDVQRAVTVVWPFKPRKFAFP